MATIGKLLPQKAVVVRDGQIREIAVAEIVPGDIVQIKVGNRIPADIRILKCDQLKTDQSLITGESEPVKGTADCTSENYLESRNVIPMGALCVEGDGTAVVVATGK